MLLTDGLYVVNEYAPPNVAFWVKGLPVLHFSLKFGHRFLLIDC